MRSAVQGGSNVIDTSTPEHLQPRQRHFPPSQAFHRPQGNPCGQRHDDLDHRGRPRYRRDRSGPARRYGGNFRIIIRLQRGNDIIGQAIALPLAERWTGQVPSGHRFSFVCVLMVKTLSGKKLACMFQSIDENIDLRTRIVKAERCPACRGDAEKVQERLRTMRACANSHPCPVYHHRHVMGVNTFKLKREDATLARRIADNASELTERKRSAA